MDNKTFTLSEANELLPQLKVDLRRLQDLMEQFEDQFIELKLQKESQKKSADHADSSNDPFFEQESKLDFMRMEVDVLIGNFSRKGVLLKMINPGLLDFPAVIDGEDVLICWKEGEERISHYHGWHDGFVGRKPFPEA